MRARLVGFVWAGWLCFGADNIDVYLLPLDANRAVVTGALARLTTGPAIDQRPTLSRDGKRIAWETSADGGANFEVRVRDLVSGDERAITSGPLREHMPAISRDGRRVVYDTHDGEKVSIFETAFGGASGAKPRLVVEENVGQGSFQFTADGKSVLYFHRAPPGTVGLLNLATGKRTPLLQHPRYNLSLSDARLSPDGRWIAFPVPYAPHRARLAVARVGNNGIVPESAWTYLTPESEATAAQPEWSPNGKWIYFLSDHTGGKLAVYALPFSPRSNAPAVPKRIADFPAPGAGGPSIHAMRPRDIGLAVAKDKLALAAAAR